MIYRVRLWMAQRYDFIIKANSQKSILEVLKRSFFVEDGDTIIGEIPYGGAELHRIEEIEEIDARKLKKLQPIINDFGLTIDHWKNILIGDRRIGRRTQYMTGSKLRMKN